jgi:cysteine synthase A
MGSREVWLKLERANPGGSIKDRIALAMVEDAEARGLLNPNSIIIEPTSGNTGIGLAMVCAVKKYRLILVMPESMSVERRAYMEALGAEFELTPRERGMSGAINRARELHESIKNSWMPSQFDNPANVRIHKETTAREILADFPDRLDAMITGVGTGGHISGCAAVLKEKFSDLKVYAVEPMASPVISGGQPGLHKIQGIGAGFIPTNFERDRVDEVIQISDEDALVYAKKIAKEEGIFVGISSGATLAAIALKLPLLPTNARVLGFCYDTGERYLSVKGFSSL